MKALHTLVRREFWEYRSLWMAPVVAAALVLGVAILSVAGATHVQLSDSDLTDITTNHLPDSMQALTGLLLLVGGLITGSYLLDCLYAERRDRSILFWKSLPVSDTTTVLVKFAVAVLIVPLGIFALGAVTHALCTLLIVLFHGKLAVFMQDWTVGDWFVGEAVLLGRLLLTTLWFAPLAAWLLIASAFARRVPILTATLPVLGLVIAESLLLGTSHFWRAIKARMVPVPDLGSALADPGLWWGVLLTAAFLVGAIRLRRYRDDT